MSENQIVKLYRIENPTHPEPRKPDGLISHEDIVGQWFSPNLPTALNYLRKSTQTFGQGAKPVRGAQLVTIHIPTEQLEAHHVTKHPVAQNMEFEGDNYIVAPNESFPREVLPLDDIVGELRGNLGNFRNLTEASHRIHAAIGLAATKKE